MAALITHLVVGERVYPQVPQLENSRASFGAFLLGCVAPDVSFLGEIDRRVTHLVGRPEEDGIAAFTESCTRFLARRDCLLRCPWPDLSGTDRALVAGYLCHLAADETWKAWGWRPTRRSGPGLSPRELEGVPPGVLVTASSVFSAEMYLDFQAVASSLGDVYVPDVFDHVSHGAFVRMWDVVRPYVLDTPTYEAYLALLARRGQSEMEIEAARAEHERHWETALSLIRDIGGIRPVVLTCVERAVEVLSRLW
jgi:hypothetical protein